ncbi:MAG: ferredoxin family protein [Rikenellaceae bacterium]|jgi:2-oxoglutarate ferredoxin oxidoreductase subunit delta|nr:ferredoxin family protein [Rikenellaceae bacterium]
MAKVRGTLVIDKERCKGCGVCLGACPFKVIELNREVNGKGYNYLYAAHPDLCTGCAGCALVCPDSCITVYRERTEQ